MNAVVFDTLILSRKLAAAGMPTDQAQGVAAAPAETLGEQIVTRRDLREAEARLETRIREVETRLREVEQRLEGRIGQLETRQETRSRELETVFRSELQSSEQRQTIRLGAMIAGGIVIVGVLVKLL